MKSFLATLSLILISTIYTYGQTGRAISGVIIDSTKATIPGATITLTSDVKSDSTSLATDINGNFTFPNITGTKIILSISSIGYQAVRKHFALNSDNKAASLGNIVLKTESNVLGQINIKGVNAIRFAEDTTEYKASAYPVRENAPVEDVIKKLPGVDVDINGNITTQGKQVTKVRINGKDFMGGDVQSITKNLPADVVENIQMIDDYGDQANLTGIKTGDPNKIMNITIRKDRNYGYTLQATGGDGEDALPQSQGIADQNRYLGTLNSFIFNGDQQIAILGSLNNTNVNTFSYGSTGGGLAGGGNGGAGFGGGGGGRGNAARGAGSSGTLITSANGITNAHSLGANFKDQWGKTLTVYGSYSFSDNDVFTNSLTNQQNLSPANPTDNNQLSDEHDANINHRFTWNMEWTPDTSNYVKITPTYSYASTVTNENEMDSLSTKSALTSKYSVVNYATSSSPSYGLNILYNHKFRNRHNFSANVSLTSTTSNSYSNPIYDYTVGAPITAADEMITTYSRTNSVGTTLSYITPLSHLTFLEFNYAFNFSQTNNFKTTDTSTTIPPSALFLADSALSNRYNFTFMTNKFGLNYRVIHPKYNYLLGFGVQPSELNGSSPQTGAQTHINTFDVIPTASFTYNFSRSHALRFYYNGSNSAPSFSQLQPVTDFSNALYPVEGNPDLKPQFTNNVMLRYNAFDFGTGNALFTNISYQQISNYITTNAITYAADVPNRFAKTVLTQYLNVPGNGYSNLTGGLVYSKPWDNRKFTLSFTGQVQYTTTVNYLSDVSYSTVTDKTDSVADRNFQKNLQFTPGFKFRVDVPDHVDVQLWSTYSINRTINSVQDSLTAGTDNIRTWSIFLNGKNYFGDWAFSYDYEKYIYYGYAKSLDVTNPNILNVYLERRFLKNNRATIRVAVYDLFNQNTGFSSTVTPSSFTETHVNRLARYYLATLTIRLQKFAGKAPAQDQGRDRRNGNGTGGNGGFPGPGGGGRGPGGGPD